MIVLLWALCFVIPMLLGLGVMTIMYGRKTNYVIGFADTYVIGFIICIGITQVAHTVGLLGELTLNETGQIGLWLTVVTSFASLIISLYGVFKCKLLYFSMRNVKEADKCLPLMVLLVFLIQSLYIFCTEAVITPGDIMLETVQSFLVEDGIYRVMPLTGVYSETGMPLRYMLLSLPTLYALLIRAFGMEGEVLICNIVPVIVLGASYLTYFRLGETIFGKGQLKKQYIFLLWVALLLTCAEGAVYLDGYSALHGGYQGTSIRNLILIPFTISAMLERRYWKAGLCIMAEVCIAWTFWGCGVCIALSVGMLIIDILVRKVPIFRKVLQIFQQEEAQI